MADFSIKNADQERFFLEMHGPFAIPGSSVTEITRAGVDGHAYRIEAIRGAVSQLTTLADVGVNLAGNDPDNPDFRTIQALYRDFIGTLCEVRYVPDSDGSTHVVYTEVMCRSVHVVGAPTPVRLGIGGLMDGLEQESRFLVRAQWTMQHTKTDYLDFP